MNAVMFHQDMIHLGSECLKYPAQEREVSSVTMSISSTLFEQIREKTKHFKNEIVQLISDNSSTNKVDRICQLNFQLFHLSETERKKSNEKPHA